MYITSIIFDNLISNSATNAKQQFRTSLNWEIQYFNDLTKCIRIYQIHSGWNNILNCW